MGKLGRPDKLTDWSRMVTLLDTAGAVALRAGIPKFLAAPDRRDQLGVALKREDWQYHSYPRAESTLLEGVTELLQAVMPSPPPPQPSEQEEASEGIKERQVSELKAEILREYKHFLSSSSGSCEAEVHCPPPPTHSCVAVHVRLLVCAIAARGI